ncbi:pyranose dehydrogenase [Coprinopsis cinerea AmutBmut pab1-1]|nr:pyranose dehydrogenase [Coprinopsis cinerea AmutBmut pab1-1]
MGVFSRIALSGLYINLALGAVYNSVAELPTDVEFDFIVAGGGTAGPVIASRLAENPDFQVLLVEAGGDNEGDINFVVPGFQRRLSSSYNWGFQTIGQTGLNGRTLNYARGKVLGGSSSTNGMVYNRGSAQDYNRWANVTGDDGWKWENLLPSIKRGEKWVLPADGRSVDGAYNPDAHGYDGELLITNFNTPPTDFDRRVQDNFNEEFPFCLDVNDGNNIGACPTQYTIGYGERSSAATAFVSTEHRNRPNFHVLLNTYVTRVLGTGDNALDFRTIEVAADSASPRQTIVASKEVVLSAGAFGSPQILLNSGIGPREELEEVGVESVLDIPDVGKNLQDHPASFAMWLANGQPSPAVDEAEAFAQWQQNRSGPLTDPGSHYIVWSRIPANASIFQEYPDDQTAPGAPHIELAISGSGPTVAASVLLLNPASRGSVKIRSNNPFDPPVIDLGFLTHRYDILAFVEGIRSAWRYFAGDGFKDHVVAPITANPDTTPLEEIEQQLRNGVGTTLHVSGSVAMSARGASNGVLDPDLKVKGATGLRVADASIMPYITTGHTVGAVYVIGERAADIIKADWS